MKNLQITITQFVNEIMKGVKCAKFRRKGGATTDTLQVYTFKKIFN